MDRPLAVVYLFLICIFFFTPIAFAQIYRLDASYNIRSTPQFQPGKIRNIIGTLNRGDKIKVLETKILPSGAKAFRIVLVESNLDLVNKKSNEIWIHQSDRRDYKMTESDICTTCETSTTTTANLEALKTVAAAAIADRTDEGFTRDSKTKYPMTTNLPIHTEKIYDNSLLSIEQKIKNYGESHAVKNLINYGKKIKANRGSGHCYRKVKSALRAAGLVHERIDSLAARYATNDLLQYGFINLLQMEPYSSQLTTPSDAPKGAVLVYSSGTACSKKTRGKIVVYEEDCGHIEIKMDEPGKPGFFSDYKSNSAINETAFSKRFGSKYKLIGIMIKPMEE